MRIQEKVSCVIPAIVKDYQWSHEVLLQYIHHLPVSRVIFIGPEDLRPLVENDRSINVDVEFINEGDILDRERVHSAYEKRKQELTEENPSQANSSFGWYYQQFIKMAFCRLCEDAYYLCWDMDTIPLRKIALFNENDQPWLDVKKEFHESYFRTINNLFGFGKQIAKSFISEHMLFNTKYMGEMIDEIMLNNAPGEEFYEKIFYNMSGMNLGFSEFETYGCWIANRYPEAYRLRYWKSFRNINFLINIHDLTEDDVNYLAKDYDAASFEKYQETEPGLTELFRNERYREKLSAERFYKELLEMGCFGEYRDGMIWTERGSFPV